MALEIKIPNVGESVTEVTLASWLVEDGDYVEMDDPICELETDKASQELYAEDSGVITLKVEEGDDLEVGALIATLDTSAKGDEKKSKDEDKEEAADDSSESEESEQSSDSDSNDEAKSYAHASPVAAKILEEHNIDPSTVKGSGQSGKITKEDALKAVEGQEEKKSSSEPDQQPEKKESKKTEEKEEEKDRPETSSDREEKREKMSRMRQTIAKRLVEVKNQTAMLTTFNEVDMTAIMEIRKKYKEIFKEKHEVGLGFMSFFTKAVCLAAREFPSVNGKIDGNEVITYNYCDVGIAVSTERGLVVPVIRDAQNLSLAGIEREVIRFAKKARDNKISLDDMKGGTFSITNGGVFGSMLSTPIINGDQSAILGMHNIVQRPMAVDGEVKIRPIMYVALSYDHRIVDGKESVSFLYRLKELLEDPARLLLEV